MENQNTKISILNKNKAILVLSTALICASVLAEKAHSDTFYFNATINNSWSSNGNWNITSRLPDRPDDIVIYGGNASGGITSFPSHVLIDTFSLVEAQAQSFGAPATPFIFQETNFNVKKFTSENSKSEVDITIGTDAKLIIEDEFTLSGDSLETLTIKNGGAVIAPADPAGQGTTTLSTNDGSNTAVLITGQSSSFSGREVILASKGKSSLRVTDRGLFATHNLVSSENENSTSSITVDQDSNLTTDTMTLGKAGASELHLLSSGTLKANHISAAETSTSSASIIFGGDDNSAPRDAGILIADSITFGEGDGSIIFNHKNQTGLAFDTAITGPAKIKFLAGKTIFHKDATNLGDTQVADSAIFVLGDGSHDISYDSNTTILKGGLIQGIGKIKSLTNTGTLSPGLVDKFGKITINGDYVGNPDSVIAFNTQLGDDNSPTDSLHITGNSSGTSTVIVTNRGGLGAETENGIKVITVDGTSDATFALKGDYITTAGQQAVVAGAYAYELKKNGISTPDDGDWYLRSDPKDCPEPTPISPCFQPGVPLYTAEAQIISMMNRDSYTSLDNRVGDRFWSGSAAYLIPQGADPIIYEDMGADTKAITDVGLVWLKASASHDKYRLTDVSANHTYRQDSYSIRAGLDNQFYESENGIAVWGLWGQFASADAKVTASFGKGKINVNNYGIGGALTWYGENGFYLDAQTQVNWYHSKLHSSTLNSTLINDHKSMGYGASLEAGKRIQYNQHWSFTPQAQLIYSTVKQDKYIDSFNTDVRSHGLSTLTGRVGISANYETAWQADNGTTSRLDTRALAGLLKNGLSNKDRIFIGDVDIKTGLKETLWSELGLGTTYSWNDGKYALYGDVKTRLAFEDIKNNYSITGNVGVRVKW